MATTSSDQTARAWSALTGLPIGPARRLPAPASGLAFAAGDSEITVHLTGGGSARLDLRPDERPLEELRRLAQVLSGREVDDRRGLVPLPPGRLRELWEGRPTDLDTGAPGR